jgi:hypothetical protein
MNLPSAFTERELSREIAILPPTAGRAAPDPYASGGLIIANATASLEGEFEPFAALPRMALPDPASGESPQ